MNKKARYCHSNQNFIINQGMGGTQVPKITKLKGSKAKSRVSLIKIISNL